MKKPVPLSLAAREVLYQKLQFMAGTVGGIANRQDEPYRSRKLDL